MQVCVVLFVLKTGVLSCIFWTHALWFCLLRGCNLLLLHVRTCEILAQFLQGTVSDGMFHFITVLFLLYDHYGPPSASTAYEQVITSEFFNPFTVTASLSVFISSWFGLAYHFLYIPSCNILVLPALV
jgi:hypothetical protein